jgi:hypothetical protein
MAKNNEDKAPSAFCLMAVMCWLRHCLRAAACLLRCRFSSLLLATERAGPLALVMAGASKSARQSSPVAVARKSRDPKPVRLLEAKVSPTVKVDD